MYSERSYYRKVPTSDAPPSRQADNDQMAQFAQWQRVRVRDAHNLKGTVVSLEDGYVVRVRFDRHPDVYPYHVEDIEPDDDPCGCVFCGGQPST
jgi:hypothetical protein